MVGSHSRGCLQCVKRKIKCDGARPHCAQCERVRLLCPGYVRPIRFMPIASNQSSTTEGCVHCALRGTVCDRRFPTCARCISLKLECSLRGLRAGSSTASNVHNIKTSPSTVVQQVKPSLPPYAAITITPTTFTSDTYGIIFLKEYFNYGLNSAEIEQIKVWIWNALQSPSEYPVSNLAVRSTIVGFFSNIHGDHKLKKEARLSYSTTIQKVRTYFSEYHQTVCFDVLSAVVLLRICEGCLSTDKAGWLSHTRGLKKLIEMQGPLYFKVQPARSLLLWTKYALFIEAMLSGHRSFLEQSEWQGILHSADEVLSRTIQLGDLGAYIPGLVEDVNQLLINTSMATKSRFKRAQALIELTAKQLQSLDSWWEDWSSDKRRRPQHLYERIHSSSETWKMLPVPLPPPRPGTGHADVLVFENLEVAAGFCHYHAFSVITLSLLNKLLSIVHSSPRNSIAHGPTHAFCCSTNDTQMSLADRVQTMLSHAYAIVQALPYYQLPQYCHSGAMYMCMPAHVAWQVFTTLPSSSPQDAAQMAQMSQWLRQMLSTTAENGGFPVVKHTLDSSSEWRL